MCNQYLDVAVHVVLDNREDASKEVWSDKEEVEKGLEQRQQEWKTKKKK